MRVFEVTVKGYGSEKFNAVSAAAAKYDAYLSSDVFCDMPFGDFIKIARVRLAALSGDGYKHLRESYPRACIPAPGTKIKAEGLIGTVLPALRPTSYVIFQPDGQDREAHVHPMSVALLAETVT